MTTLKPHSIFYSSSCIADGCKGESVSIVPRNTHWCAPCIAKNRARYGWAAR